MTILLQPIVLLMIAVAIMVIFGFFVIDSIFERRAPKKWIIAYLAAIILIHAFMSSNYLGMMLRSYFLVLAIIALPAFFYTGDKLAKRTGSGMILSFLFLWTDLFTFILYYILLGSRTGVPIAFSPERHISYIVMYLIILPLIFNPVKRMFAYFMRKSTFFFYQIFLLLIFFVFEVGVINYVIAIDAAESAFYVLNHIEIMIFVGRFFCFIFLNGFIFYVLQHLDKSYKTEMNLQLYKKKAEMQQTFYKLTEKQYNQSRELAHDFKNHVLTIEYLYETDEKKEASSYIESVLKNMETIMSENTKASYDLIEASAKEEVGKE